MNTREAPPAPPEAARHRRDTATAPPASPTSQPLREHEPRQTDRARRLRSGVLGATGMVGREFVARLARHPWFEVTAVAASPRSAGRTLAEAVDGGAASGSTLPECAATLVVADVAEVDEVAEQVDVVFSALAMDKAQVRALEEAYARREVPVVSANSAHRWTADVPMIVPEVNAEHAGVIPAQRRRLGTDRGFIAVKPNCSIQPYLLPLHALLDYRPQRITVCTCQAISGAGRTPGEWPEMEDNIIPFIAGEEEKSSREPLKIWGQTRDDRIVPAEGLPISAQCLRVPVSDGHLAAVSVEFERKPQPLDVLHRWQEFEGRPQRLKLPSAPDPCLRYHADEERPQVRLDRDAGNGMAVSIGRLRDDEILDYRFVALSHNTGRGAAGGALLMAELLAAEGYLAN